jgi:hypothetical protein
VLRLVRNIAPIMPTKARSFVTEKPNKRHAPRKKSAAGITDQAAAIEAMRLLGKWLRLAQGHVSFGTHCSCGMAASNGNIQVQDFETEILAYLFGRHTDPVNERVLGTLREHAGYVPGKAGSITELLRAISAGTPELAAELRLALLQDLARSIESFEEFHGG